MKTTEHPVSANQALADAELEKVSGGKVQLQDLTITKHYDKSSSKPG